jgi:hypothetical protein
MSSIVNSNFNFKLINPKHKTLGECKAYIREYFVPLLDGNHAVLENGKYVIRDKTALRHVYFDRMPDYVTGDDDDKKPIDLSKWYFNKYTDIRSITYELNKPTFYDDKLNMCPKMKYEYFKYDYEEDVNKPLKVKVNIMLNYIKEVLANGSDDVYKYILQWLSHMVKGNKNDSILYLKSKQGFGKSTLLEFMREFVIGDDLSLETGSGPIVSNFNAILGGKLFVYFEELETFSIAQWMAISSRLKRYATSSTITLEDKNIKAYTTKNIMNIIVASNNDAIMDDDGRRYMILDIATHRQVIPNCNTPRNEENKKFWNDIRSCFNEEVGKAFYSYLIEVDTSDYRPQNFPITQNKLDSYAKRMESHELFLKFNYVLRRGELKTTVGEIYEEYVAYCRGNGIIKPLTKIDLNKKLKEIGIESYKSNKDLKISLTADELAEIAKCHNWVHDTDEYYDDESKDKKTNNGLDFVDGVHPEVRVEELEKDLREEKKQHHELSIKFDEMKAQLEELQKKLLQIQPPEPPKPQELDLLSMIENAPEGKLIQVSDETKEKLNKKI